MSGVRVSNVPREASEKELHAYFANPSHGGGKIKSIHYPVFSDYSLSDDAVIIFEEVHSKFFSFLVVCKILELRLKK